MQAGSQQGLGLIVVKGYGRCCHGNYRAHMRIPDVTTIWTLKAQNNQRLCKSHHDCKLDTWEALDAANNTPSHAD